MGSAGGQDPSPGPIVMSMEDNVALVTGASQGIGRAIAEHLASSGARVVVNFYPTEHAEVANVVDGIEKAGGTAIAAAADIADAGQLRGLFDTAEEHFGRLDVVVLNAANVRHATFIDTTDEQFDAIFATNTRSGFIAMRECALRLRDGGRIVVVSAGLALLPREGTGAYAASKAALNHLVRVLAREVGHRGITVNAVLPGAVETQALLDAGPAIIEAEIGLTPLARLGRPEDIADIVDFLVSERARWVTGQLIGAGGGMF
jgi:3-oxoacyl-[acyl-carrier protein] reductase